jgi:hypothetical protein
VVVQARAEFVAGAVLAVISVIAEVLQMNFSWSVIIVLAFMAVAVDLCLRSGAEQEFFAPTVLAHHFINRYDASDWSFVLNTSRKKYMTEHLPPSFIYVAPGFWSPSPKPQWFMLVRHYGPHTVFKANGLFVDDDRAEALRRRGMPISPQDINQGQMTFHFAEVDRIEPIFAHSLAWSPLNPGHERYSIAITSRADIRINETLEIQRIRDRWAWKMTIQQLPSGTILVHCQDAGFSDSGVTRGCFPDFISKHQGDAHLPLQLPTNENDAAMMVSILIYAGLVFWPLYCGLAMWWMGERELFL